jgi:abhydrolase domain-containing protein 6
MPESFFIAALLTLGFAIIAVAAMRLRRRPMETGRRLLRWLLLLRGARECWMDTACGRIHYYEIAPDSPSHDPVIFLTGLGGTGADWHGILTAVARTGRRVFAVELAGQGQTRTIPELTLFPMRLQLRLLDDFLRAKGLARVTLVGISLGGWIASLFAVSAPDRLHRLVLVASAGLRGPLGSRDVQPRNRAEARVFLNRILALHPWVPGWVLDDFVRRLNSSTIRKIIEAITEADFLDPQLPQVQIPVDLIWGAQDELIGLDQAQRFQAGLPHARLHLIARCGHLPMIERPWRFRRLLLEILEGRP